MSDHTADPSDASRSPVPYRTDVPTPRIGTPATEATQESIRAERDAVGDEPDIGGLTPTDDAQ